MRHPCKVCSSDDAAWCKVAGHYADARPADGPPTTRDEMAEWIVLETTDTVWAELTEREKNRYRRCVTLILPPPDTPSGSIATALRRALKRYQRDIPCSCHDCRRDAGATDGVGTNGGCKHSTLRSIQATLRVRGPAPQEGDQPEGGGGGQ